MTANEGKICFFVYRSEEGMSEEGGEEEEFFGERGYVRCSHGKGLRETRKISEERGREGYCNNSPKTKAPQKISTSKKLLHVAATDYLQL